MVARGESVFGPTGLWSRPLHQGLAPLANNRRRSAAEPDSNTWQDNGGTPMALTLHVRLTLISFHTASEIT